MPALCANCRHLSKTGYLLAQCGAKPINVISRAAPPMACPLRGGNDAEAVHD